MPLFDVRLKYFVESSFIKEGLLHWERLGKPHRKQLTTVQQPGSIQSPVSYTHLDVYKRQVYRTVLSSNIVLQNLLLYRFSSSIVDICNF